MQIMEICLVAIIFGLYALRNADIIPVFSVFSSRRQVLRLLFSVPNIRNSLEPQTVYYARGLAPLAADHQKYLGERRR
jgi:hypothetical protein